MEGGGGGGGGAEVGVTEEEGCEGASSTLTTVNTHTAHTK